MPSQTRIIALKNISLGILYTPVIILMRLIMFNHKLFQCDGWLDLFLQN